MRKQAKRIYKDYYKTISKQQILSMKKGVAKMLLSSPFKDNRDLAKHILKIY